MLRNLRQCEYGHWQHSVVAFHIFRLNVVNLCIIKGPITNVKEVCRFGVSGVSESLRASDDVSAVAPGQT